MLVEIGGINSALAIGQRCAIITAANKQILCEIIGFRGGQALAMPFADTEGVGAGNKAYIVSRQPVVYPHEAWLGRTVNALGHAIDDKGSLLHGMRPVRLRNTPPPANRRQRLGGMMDVGVRALNTFLATCEGQRLGIFSGSGVGKSTLMAMLARYTEADVIVIGLVGERGREVQEFIHDTLGEDGLARSVLVVATSDESPLMRRQAAYMTLAVAEYFRDEGKKVLCLMDSVTRFAQAQREIGLSAGEPPASKGYTPTVFAELPRLLERAGTGEAGQGSITAFFSVLVEGDDTNEPISDAVRGILDGHIVLSRAIAERGRFPAIDILRSISRSMPACNTPEQTAFINKARGYLAAYSNMEELIRIGAYKAGSDAQVDEARRFVPAIEDFLKQDIDERTTLEEGFYRLTRVLTDQGEYHEET
jgi:flagellum-specific ATP synthase